MEHWDFADAWMVALDTLSPSASNWSGNIEWKTRLVFSLLPNITFPNITCFVLLFKAFKAHFSVSNHILTTLVTW